jgi:hypothetical protein
MKNNATVLFNLFVHVEKKKRFVQFFEEINNFSMVKFSFLQVHF